VDIFAHGLWAAAAARVSNGREPARRRVSVAWVAFFGVFPDLFAFAWPITRALWARLFEGAGHAHPDRDLAWNLYHFSHSLIVFGAVFGVVWLVKKRPAWELLGWALHILIDIPSHSLRFFPTPFLWPLSDYRFGGISWANRWFMLANYTSLAAAYIALWRRRKVKSEPEKA